MNRHRLDVRRLLCPIPVIRLQARCKDLRPGDQIEVICTDPGARYDVPAWCRLNGHSILAIDETSAAKEWLILVELGVKPPRPT